MRRALAGAAVLLAAGLLWWWTGRVREDPPLGRPFEGELVRLTSATGRHVHPSLSPDGRALVFSTEASGKGDIILYDIAARESRNLTNSDDEDAEPAYSPDGRWIAFRSTRQNGGLYLVHREGGRLRRLTQFGASPAWTPDGRWIVFASRGPDEPIDRGRSGGWKVEVATGLTTRLTGGDFSQPAVSPSGQRVAYSASRSEGGPRLLAPRADIWTMGQDGNGPTPVTSDAALDWSPSWSADGKHLYFLSNRGGMTGLWGVRIDERTGRVRGDPVSVPSPVAAVGPMTRSADGRRFAWAVPAPGRGLYQVAFNPDARSVNGQPAPVLESTGGWSCAEAAPDGAAIAWRALDPRDGMHVADTEGGSARRISGDVVAEGCPRWSPDGSRLAFHGHRGDVNALWIVSPDGSDLQLATRTVGALTHPVWSPDGTRLAAYDGFQGKVRVFAVSGETPVRDSVEALPQFSQGTFVPFSWAPDGSSLAGTITGSVWVYSFESGALERIAEGASPAWLNTSRRIMAGSSGRIVLVDVPTKFTREILAEPHEHFASPHLSPDNTTLYVTRERAEADIWLLTRRR